MTTTVRQAREQAGMTQVDLAVAAGVSPATVHRIEAGRHTPFMSTRVVIADALGVDVESLSWGEGPTSSRAHESIDDTAPTDAARRVPVGADHTGA